MRHVWRYALGALAAVFVLGAVPPQNAVVSVPNTAELRKLSTAAAYGGTVLRITDGVAGAGPLPFLPGSGTCPKDDGASCVNAPGGHWNGQFPATGADVRQFSAPNDGVTDAGVAINACTAAENVCLIPSTLAGFYISTPVVVPYNHWLKGVSVSGANASTGFAFPGQSWLLCKNTGAQNCVTWGTAGASGSGGVENLVIAGMAGIPASGSKGLVYAGGYNVQMNKLSISNFDTCAEFDQGISGQGISNYLQFCYTHYWVFNSWTEFSQTGGRSGANGTGNYNHATDNVYFTSSLGSGGGGTGPNSIDFVNYKFENDQTVCWLNWGNWTVTPGNSQNFNFVNIYKEPGASAGGTSLFCSDGTVPAIGSVNVDNGFFSQDSGVMTLTSGMSPNTKMDKWAWTNNKFFISPSTIAPTGANPGFSSDVFSGNYFSSLTLTPGGASRNDRLNLIGNHYGGFLTLNQGSFGWFGLNMVGEVVAGTFTNNTDGSNQTIVATPNMGIAPGNRIVSSLPVCSSLLKGQSLSVRDASSPVLGATVVGGGTIWLWVICNGTNWTVQ